MLFTMVYYYCMAHAAWATYLVTSIGSEFSTQTEITPNLQIAHVSKRDLSKSHLFESYTYMHLLGIIKVTTKLNK